MKSKFFVAVLVIFFTGVSSASGITTAMPVTMFHYFKGHIGLLIKQPSIINPDACPRNDFYILPMDHRNYNEMVAMILVSHVKGLPLSFGVEGCTEGFPTVAHLYSSK